jgi:rhodanese-related sulfurtransferase
MPPDRNDPTPTPTPTAGPNEPADVQRISVTEAHALIVGGRGVLVDTRGRYLYDNTHAAGAVSLPLVEIEAAEGRVRVDSVPPDRVLILYCA